MLSFLFLFLLLQDLPRTPKVSKEARHKNIKRRFKVSLYKHSATRHSTCHLHSFPLPFRLSSFSLITLKWYRQFSFPSFYYSSYFFWYSPETTLPCISHFCLNFLLPFETLFFHFRPFPFLFFFSSIYSPSTVRLSFTRLPDFPHSSHFLMQHVSRLY